MTITEDIDDYKLSEFNKEWISIYGGFELCINNRIEVIVLRGNTALEKNGQKIYEYAASTSKRLFKYIIIKNMRYICLQVFVEN